MLHRLFFLATLLLLPSIAAAEQTTVWDFTNGRLPVKWQIKNIDSAVPTAAGLEIQTQQQGGMGKIMDVAHGIDTARIILSSQDQIEALFVWHRPRTPENEMVQMPVLLGPGVYVTLPIDLTPFRQWNRHTDFIGLMFPPGTNITIHRIELTGYSLPEKAINMWKSFWIFDGFHPTSINFLWGPVLRSTPITQAALFYNPPPQGWSVNRVFYALLGLAGGIALFLRLFRRWNGRAALLLFLAVAAALWLFFDARMGAELFTYATTANQGYLQKPPGDRTYGTFGEFYDAVDVSLPLLTSEPTYEFLAPGNIPLESRIRYFTYPSLPVRPDSSERPKTWIVLRRPDVAVDGEGRLVVGGTAVTEGGNVIHMFENGSFLYQTP